MDFHARTDRLAQLLEERLDIRGAGFETKLRRAGRLLPRHLRREGEVLSEALRLSSHPRLGRQVDTKRLAKAADAIESYLLDLDAWDRRRGIAVNVSASVLLNILVVAALVAGVIIWRGLV
ncbi:hypothetical protein MUY35_04290 [Aliiroseovarius sp. S1339]|uniref:hypothetical protein n=1 Tax=Aliiroseovarius sp. S1339 TaxID=2936990 RepID=UPI0020BEC3B2|nr:hypothetical protein [Aliiroseovarius sp. S1339]MCK8463066.1 hypothetical protein [Aliiroseovarius sp. S1339]